MTSEELYYELHLLVNKNNEDSKINIEKLHFVTLFNRELDNFLNETLISDNNSLQISYLQDFLKEIKSLDISESHKDYNSYQLPDGFFHISSVIANCEKGECERKMFCYEIHPKEINIVLQDEFSKPSFDWEESIFILLNNELIVYKEEDVDIKECSIQYYSNDFKIDLSGHTKINGTYSKNVNSELSDFLQRKILNRVALEISREFEDVNKFQLSKTRIV